MSQSRETRVPYLDYNLVEFCLRLPSTFKISQGLSKKILREAAKDVLPDKIYSRVDKQGYSSPVARWAKKELSGFFRSNLEKSLDLPFVRKDNIMASFDKFVKTGAPFDPVWWRIINTKRWMDIFKVSL
jgi:asparagine synthase (glutamine-hydrolysing)